MQPNEVRSRYLKFFEKNGHKIIPSASLVPQNDPTTLFTGSGMQPLVPYLLGKNHPEGTRLTNSQKCFRSGDIEEVGDNRHTTFFEMLGNWSLGDYFKEEQLPWFFEFLTNEIGLDPKKLYVTVFIGDEKNNVPRDTKSAEVWKGLFAKKGIEAKDVLIGSEEDGYKNGMQGGRIFYYEAKKNWWSRAGVPENMPEGEPGGPDSEVFYDFGIEHDKKWGEHCHPNCDCGRFLEIGNSVFMQYIKKEDGTFGLLPKQNVDFGGGLERIVMAKNESPDIILVNHKPIIEHLEKESDRKYGAKEEEVRAFRIIADHMKAAVFLIADGVNPSNTDQGYFVRRLIRRAVRYADMLGIHEGTFSKVVRPIAKMYSEQYPEVGSKAEEIEKAVAEEENKFRITLARGLKEFEKLSTSNISGTDAFMLFSTYGFPLEVTEELAKEKGISIDIDSFKKEMIKHQDLSRSGSEQKFKGGLADHAEATVRLHTTHHLLLASLRKILGDHVYQRGSNITSERLRIDFANPEKVTSEQLAQAEDMVNGWIKQKIPVHRAEMPRAEAEKIGAQMEFGAKYPDMVSVYYIGDSIENAVSKEFCGGPHVENTGVLGTFKIQKEEAVASGIRRIKAVLV